MEISSKAAQTSSTMKSHPVPLPFLPSHITANGIHRKEKNPTSLKRKKGQNRGNGSKCFCLAFNGEEKTFIVLCITARFSQPGHLSRFLKITKILHQNTIRVQLKLRTPSSMKITLF